MTTRIEKGATSARGTTTGRRNAIPESKKANPAQTAEDKNTGQKDSPLRRKQQGNQVPLFQH
jgi:hypothetical protein